MSGRDFARSLVSGVQASMVDTYLDRIGKLPDSLAGKQVDLASDCLAWLRVCAWFPAVHRLEACPAAVTALSLCACLAGSAGINFECVHFSISMLAWHASPTGSFSSETMQIH